MCTEQQMNSDVFDRLQLLEDGDCLIFPPKLSLEEKGQAARHSS